MHIKMRDWKGKYINVTYVATMVRDALKAVITGTDTVFTLKPETVAYNLCGETLVLAVNHGNYPEVYVCKILRYGCKTDDDVLIIED
jgi:hypothetical protein